MQVILKSDVKGLGKAFDVVKVKDGYGRNWLFPQQLAIPATANNLRLIDAEKRRQASRLAKLKTEAEVLAKKLEGISLTVSVRVKEGDQLYGSVTAADIAAKLATTGVDLDRGKIDLEEPIKALGVYTVPVKLHPEVESRIKVWVVKQAG